MWGALAVVTLAGGNLGLRYTSCMDSMKKECKLGYLLLCSDEMIFPLKLGESKLWSLNHFVS